MFRYLLTGLFLSILGGHSIVNASVFEKCPHTMDPTTFVSCVQVGKCDNSGSRTCAVSKVFSGKGYTAYESCSVVVSPTGKSITKLYVNHGQLGDVGLDPAISTDRSIEIFRRVKCAQDKSISAGNACVLTRNPTTGNLLSWTTLFCKKF